MIKCNGFLTCLFTLSVLQVQAQRILVSPDSTKIPNVELSEIIISASRDNSKLKEMPTAVSSIRSAQIKNNQMRSLEDVSTFAPNFMMLDYGTKIMSPIYIRGVGSKKSSVAPSVGLYVDGIPFFDNSALSFDFYDISQVEVLRGPQGTLYGRNTIGGLINIRTLSPMTYQGTNLRFGVEGNGSLTSNVGHYGKQGNRLAYSIAGNFRRQTGYFENKHDGKAADRMSSYGVRNRLILQANDKLSIENIFSLEKSEQGGYPYAPYVDSIAALGDVNYNASSGYERFMFNEGLNFNYEKEKWLVTATLACQYIDDKQDLDQDFTPKDFYFVSQNQKQNLYSGEMTARSTKNKTYHWMVGAYGLQHRLSKDVTVNYYPPINAALKKDELFKDYAAVNSSAGVFHQSKVQFFKHLFVEAGLRFNYEKSRLEYFEQKKYEDAVSTSADTVFSPLKEVIFLPKIALSYKDENFTLYASYSTGYKPGGFNSTFEETHQIQYKKESSHNYELGFKADILQGIIYSDFTLFLTEIKGQQIARSLTSLTGTYLDNSGKSRNKGAEFSLNTAPVGGFEASVSYGYTLAKIIQYKKNETTDYGGNITPFIPNHTLNVTLAKTVETPHICFLDNVRFQLNLSQVGDIYWNIENEESQASYNTLNALISLKYKGAKLDVWGKNLMNTAYNAYLFKTSAWYGQKGLPQRFGATFSMNF